MTFAEKISAIESDVLEMQVMQAALERIIERGLEAGPGESMLLAIEVLLRKAVTHYEEEIATLKGPGAAA